MPREVSAVARGSRSGQRFGYFRREAAIGRAASEDPEVLRAW